MKKQLFFWNTIRISDIKTFLLLNYFDKISLNFTLILKENPRLVLFVS